MEQGKREVIIVNPFVTKSNIGDSMGKIAQSEVEMFLITREPLDDHYSAEDKIKFLTSLAKKGVKMYYNKHVHAKIVIVDRSVVIVSSLNFYPNAISGTSWEAGLVTIDDEVVDAISNSVQGLLYDDGTRRIV